MKTIPASPAIRAPRTPPSGTGFPIAASRLMVIAAVCAPLAAPAATLPEPILRPTRELDIRRVGSVSEEQREVLRDEWLLAQGRGDGSRLVAELMARIDRLEAIARGLNGAIARIPERRPPPAPPPPPSALANPSLHYALSAALALLAGAGGLWWGRRRRPATEAASPAVAPAASKAPVAPPRATTQSPAAVPPSLTFTGQKVIAEPAPRNLDTIRMTAIPLPASDNTPTPAATPRVIEFERPAKPATTKTSPAEPSMQDTLVFDSPFTERLNAERAALDPGSALAAEFGGGKPSADPLPAPAHAAETVASGVFAAVTEAHSANDEALELAEIMLSMGLASGAAQTLTEHIRANPRRALYHWLKLLDIHRKTGDEDQFETAANELRQYFNIQAEGWTPSTDGDTPTLESFARIVAQVQANWQRPAECVTHLSQLLEDNRGGTRMGFPRPVAEEILLLIAIQKLAAGEA